ncbi:hypothetical protein JHE06_07975 [Carnobacterium sp. CS13]|uniref:hypothetical protein n=1 Tax=Carnobacterium sp. CS13 TaxID=2800128 RepID=UPI001912C60D|nr:hypothetical protein [Carnobacterium sp. CS13]QQP69552.1 hypothetical protein JHE06_07975 [Carnobacterium sp. CS13]
MSEKIIKEGILGKIFTSILILFPILGIYSTFMPGITMGDLLLMIIILFLLIDFIKKDVLVSELLYKPMFFYSILIFWNLLYAILVNNLVQTQGVIIGNTLHYLLYCITIAFFIKQYFNINYAHKFFEIVAVISSVYLIIQYLLLEIFGYYLPGVLPFMETINTSIDRMFVLASINKLSRVSSFFAEPSHFAVFGVLFLCINLFSFNNQIKKRSHLSGVIVTIAILLSQSSTGIIVVILLWLLWVLKKVISFEAKRKKLQYILILITLFPILVYFLLNSAVFDVFINRTFSSQGGSAATNRFGNINIFDYVKGNSIVELFFGKGMIDLIEYIPGFVRSFYFFGLIGVLVTAFLLLYMFKKGNNLQKIIILIFLILNIGTEILFGNFILLYFSFSIISYDDSNEKNLQI